MAGKSTKQAEIEELIRISAEAREELGVKIGKVRRTLNVPTRVVGSLKQSPKSWLLGSMAAGVIGSLALNQLPRRKKKRKGLKKLAMALTLTATRPLAKAWLTNQLKSLGGKWINQRIKPQPSPFQIEPEPPIHGEPYQNPHDVRAPGP